MDMPNHQRKPEISAFELHNRGDTNEWAPLLQNAAIMKQRRKILEYKVQYHN